MDGLDLTPELLERIKDWMKPKYSLSTQHIRCSYLNKIFDECNILDGDTLRILMKKIKFQHQRAVLVMINKFCYDNNINFNLNIPSIKKQASKLPEILSPAEIKLMIESAPRPYDLVIRCIFNMGAGLRISEIIKFSWNHIRWIDWLRDKDSYGVAVIKSGKGSKDRTVNIPKRLMHDLYEYAKECDVLNEFKIPSGGMIFDFGYAALSDKKTKKSNELMAYDKERWKYDYVKTRYDWFRYHILEGKCEKALNKHIKIHSLRHSRATYLYEVEKVPIEKIQILLGHRSMETTLLYTKINPTSVFEMVKDTKEI